MCFTLPKLCFFLDGRKEPMAESQHLLSILLLESSFGKKLLTEDWGLRVSCLEMTRVFRLWDRDSILTMVKLLLLKRKRTNIFKVL